MKKLCIIHIALLSAVCLAAPTANEEFVIAEDARTYTNAVQAAKTYTDQATNDVRTVLTNYTRRVLGDYVTFRNLDDAMTDVKSDAIYEAGTNATAAINAATQAVIRAIPPAPTDYIPVWEDDGWLVNEGEQISFTTLRTGDFYPDFVWLRSWSNIALQNDTTLPQYLSSREVALTNGLVLTESDPTVHSWAKSATKPAYTSDEVGAYAAGAGTNLAGVVNLWETYWDGDEVRVTVTNYDSSVHLPSLYLEQKIENTNAYRVVWSESTRWASNALEMAELRSAVDEKADRAWGFYDSHTGEYAPDGYTWLSSPKIAIAGGLAYQRTLTTDGAVWVLVSNGMVAETGGEVTNGFFRIKDDEGNTTFEIVRGNRRTVGATAAGIRVTRSGSSNVVTVPYNVVSEEHPTVYGTTNLSSGEWTELAATWLGQSGAWTAQVSSASATFFIKGEYETGGETYIRNAAPISVEGGLYATNTASGGFVKIRPKYNGSTITWELAQ